MSSSFLKKLCFHMRKIHRWAVPFVALPLLVIVVTGIPLLLRREFEALQPSSRHGEKPGVGLTLEDLLAIAKRYASDETTALAEIKELRILPQQGITKVRMKDGREIQLDNHSGAVLFAGKTWTSFLIALHEGTIFSLAVSYWIYLPASFLLLVLWFSGLVMLWGQRRWKMTRKQKAG